MALQPMAYLQPMESGQINLCNLVQLMASIARRKAFLTTSHAKIKKEQKRKKATSQGVHNGEVKRPKKILRPLGRVVLMRVGTRDEVVGVAVGELIGVIGVDIGGGEAMHLEIDIYHELMSGRTEPLQEKI